MTTLDATALAHAMRRDVRAWTKAEVQLRWSAPALRSALLAGDVVRMFPGIYAAAEHSQSLATRAHAAHLWCGSESVLVGAGAASVWDFGDAPHTVVIAAPYGVKRHCPPWLTIRRVAEPVPLALWGACPVARADWAAVTAYATTPPSTRDGFLYRAAQSGKATAEDLLRVAAAMPRLRGRRHLESVVAAIGAGSESHLETTGLRRVFNTGEFAEFIRQHWVQTPAGNYRLDMFHPPSQTAVELDGAGPHGKPESRQRDITRDVNVASVGILTLRISSADIYRRVAWCRDSVQRVIASRA